jgi:hypothetical protein
MATDGERRRPHRSHLAACVLPRQAPNCVSWHLAGKRRAEAGRDRQRPEAARGSQRHAIPAAIAPFSSRRVGSVSVRSGEHIGSAVHARLEDHGTAALVQRPPSARSGHGHDRRVRHRIGVVGQKGRRAEEASKLAFQAAANTKTTRPIRPSAALVRLQRRLTPQHLSTHTPAPSRRQPQPGTTRSTLAPRHGQPYLRLARVVTRHSTPVAASSRAWAARHDVASTAATASRNLPLRPRLHGEPRSQMPQPMIAQPHSHSP